MAKKNELIGGKQTRKEDKVSWGIVTIYLRTEMKKSGVNSGWSITGKNSLDMNSSLCSTYEENVSYKSACSLCCCC